MKKTSLLLSLLITLGFSFGSVGCSILGTEKNSAPAAAVGIASIEKTGTDGNVDTYTIYYTDGSTSTFTVTNGQDGKDGADGLHGQDGKDGKDGEDFTAQDLYLAYKEKNGVELSYEEFLALYLSVGKDGKDGKDGVDGLDGVNGKDGEDLTAEDLYLTYKEQTGSEITYEEFLSLYLTVGTDERAINHCLLSSVKFYCEFTEEDTAAPDGVNPLCYTGGGVIYEIGEEYTYLLTNYHVVYDTDAVTESKLPQKIHCYLYGSEWTPEKSTENGKTTYSYDDGYAIECEYVGGAASCDVAVVKAKTADVKAINPDVRAVTIADGYYVGETAYAIGNPQGEGISVTKGIVSVESEYINLDVDGTVRSYRSIRMDTPLYKGNSGGGMFNGKGELIGLANAGDLEAQNINYGVPCSIVKGVADNVIFYANDGNDQTNGAYKIKLGVTVTAENQKFVYDPEKGYGNIQEEITVSELTLLGLAQQMGLKTGAILKAIVIEGEKYELDRIFDIGDLLFNVTAGETFFFLYSYGGSDELQTRSHTVQASELIKVE